MGRIMKKRSPWFYIVVIFVGSLIGTAMGEALGVILPDGVVREFFLRAVEFGINPLEIDILVLSFTIGFKVKLNIIGAIGVLLAAHFLKWVD